MNEHSRICEKCGAETTERSKLLFEGRCMDCARLYYGAGPVTVCDSDKPELPDTSTEWKQEAGYSETVSDMDTVGVGRDDG